MSEKNIFKLSTPRFRVKQIMMNLEENVDWGLLSLGIPEIWKQTRGEGIKVAVLDSGIDYQHPDLADALDAIKDFTQSPYSGPYDIFGHGTHVSGIIGARENDRGIIGVAPKCRLIAGKILNDEGEGELLWLAQAIHWAIEQNVDIISLSLGTTTDSPDVQHAIKTAVNQNKIVIAAAGNEGTYSLDSINYPARYDECISVGSINRNQLRSSFSSIGARLDIVAPGEDINSCFPPRSYALLSGTSMATPFAAGVAALILSKHRSHPESSTPCENQEQMRQHLIDCAVDLGQIGRDYYYGYGLISPRDLLGETRRVAIHISQDDLTPIGRKKLEDALRTSMVRVPYDVGQRKELECSIDFNLAQHLFSIEIFPREESSP